MKRKWRQWEIGNSGKPVHYRLQCVINKLPEDIYDPWDFSAKGMLDRVKRLWCVTIDKKANRVIISNLDEGDFEALSAACKKLGYCWEYDHEPCSLMGVPKRG